MDLHNKDRVIARNQSRYRQHIAHLSVEGSHKYIAIMQLRDANAALSSEVEDLRARLGIVTGFNAPTGPVP